MTTPPCWGTDALTAFLDDARNNQNATFHNLGRMSRVLIEIDGCFSLAGKDMINPKDGVVATFLFRAHSAYRAACGLVMAGQCPEAAALLRSCLEYAAYGLYASREPQALEAWLNRGMDAAAKKKSVKAFQIGQMRPVIEQCEKHLAVIFDTLYERAIDVGAHPNELAVFGNMALSKSEEGTQFKQIYLQGDGVMLRSTLKFTAEVGLCALFLQQHVFPERFMLLGVREQLQALRGRVSRMAKDEAFPMRGS